MKSEFDEFSNSMMKFDGDVPRGFEDFVLHVSVGDWFAGVVFTTDAEEHVDL